MRKLSSKTKAKMGLEAWKLGSCMLSLNRQTNKQTNQTETQKLNKKTKTSVTKINCTEFGGKSHKPRLRGVCRLPFFPASFLGPTCVGGGGGALSVLSAKSLSLSLMLT